MTEKPSARLAHLLALAGFTQIMLKFEQILNSHKQLKNNRLNNHSHKIGK